MLIPYRRCQELRLRSRPIRRKHDGRHQPHPRPAQRAGARLRAGLAPSAGSCSASWPSWPADADRADLHHRRRSSGWAAASAARSSQPHRHAHVLGEFGQTPPSRTPGTRWPRRAAAAPAWRAMSYADRAAIFLRAADLLAGPWRATLNAATMLGQSKTAIQAEIDAACELIDFWRFNAAFGAQVLAEQPISSPGIWNRLDHRPLEGFVYAITPFNFTAIAGNLPTAPALMGNVVIWKPSNTQLLAAHFTMRLLEAAGLPPGVINLLTGDGLAVSEVLLPHPDLAGIHFTGSTATFQHLWQTVGAEPRRATGPTRGWSARPAARTSCWPTRSADLDVLRTALIRGAFEYQGQKCSAASRAYVPASLWPQLQGRPGRADRRADRWATSPTSATSCGAVIDRRAFDQLAGVLDAAKNDPALEILAGGTADDSEGFFVRPTILRQPTTRPRGVHHRVLRPDPGGLRLRRRADPDALRRDPGRGRRRPPRTG